MKIELLALGKATDKSLTSAIDDYKERISHYAEFSVTILSSLKNTKTLSINQQKTVEGELILKHIDSSDIVVLLDERGREMRSIEFAKWVENKLQTAKKVVFVIGGPFGFSDNVYKRANEMVSLSKLTFPHQMVRLIFLEQIYRAFTIIKGEPYHHE